MKPFVENKILQNFPIKEGTPIYAGWLEPPVTPVVQFRVFNLTNKESFLAGEFFLSYQSPLTLALLFIFFFVLTFANLNCKNVGTKLRPANILKPLNSVSQYSCQ